ncbi:MAG: CHAT domain-containing protein [Geminocystis sp.]|nr:CHAT domain-containing protein [Geminocystis sp.]
MWKKVNLYVAALSLLLTLNNSPSKAQEIITDGTTATIVTRNGQRIVIDGNTLSRDGKNLFHSFREFGLTPQEIATFLTNSYIQNILTRVTGGNPSYINGLIEVVGGNSNLFIMNPAGIVFGKNARVNVPADFVATTATGISFENGIFNAVGNNDYQNLVGNPTSFIFNTNQPGSIINAGHLQAGEGRKITLVGGNVINTGTIETAGGKIHIEAVEGTSRIKITPEGSLLSLELEIPRDAQGNLLEFTPQDLPTLLTGANGAGVETPKVTASNNQVEVENTSIPSGGVAIVSGRLTASSSNKGGEITVTGSKVGVIKAEITANGETGGGEVLIGGDYKGKGSITNSQVTVVGKDSKIEANALTRGDGGRVIVWSDGNTAFRGEIAAKGGSEGGNGGFVEVSGKENLNFQGRVDTSAPRGNSGTLLLDPENVLIVDQTSAGDDFQLSDGQVLAGDGAGRDYTISRGILESLSYLSNIVIEANNNIVIEDLQDNLLSLQFPTSPFPSLTSITFRADANNDGSGDFLMATDDVIRAPGRNVNIFGNNIIVGTIDTVPPSGFSSVNGGNININARRDVTIGDRITGGRLVTFIPPESSGNAGNVSVTSQNGSITIMGDIIATFTPNGQAGSIILEATNGDINLPSFFFLESGLGDTDTSGLIILRARNINPNFDLPSTAVFLARGGISINTENLNVALENRLNSPLEITGSNILNLNQTIGNVGSVNLSLSSPGSISIGADIAADSLTVNAATTNLRGNINTNGNQDYNTNLLLTGDVQLTGGNINFNGSIDSAATPHSLTVGAVDNIRYNGQVGATVGLNNLENTARDIFLNISRSGLAADAPSIRTLGDQSYTLTSNTLYLTEDTVINTSNFNLDGNIKVAESASQGVSLTINASGGVRITAPSSGDVTGAINTAKGNRGGDVTINASGDIVVDGVITASNPTPTTIVPQGGNVSIQSSSGNLVLGPIGTVGVTQSGRISLRGQNIAVGTIVTEINQGGQILGRGGGIDISANNALVVGNILGESLTATGNLLLTNLGVLQQPLPGNVPPEYQPFLTTSRIITSGSQQYNGQLFLDDNTIINGSNIRIGAVDSFDLNLPGAISQLTPPQVVTSILNSIANRGNANASSLTLNATRGLNLEGEIGSVAGLANLTVSSPATSVNAPLIRTTGDQIYNTPLLLGGDVTLTSNSFIRLLRDVTGVGNLTLNSDSVFVGGKVDIGSLSVTASNFFVRTDNIETSGSQQIDSIISLQNSVNFKAGGVFSARNIAGSGTSININANTISVGDIATGGGNINLNARGTNTITAGNIISGGGNINLTSSGDIQVGSVSSRGNARSGNIQISTPGNLQVTGFSSRGVSVDAGEGGSVTIDLFPGGLGLSSRLPFTVGNPARNGTAGIITNTNFFIPPGDYFFTTEIGNLRLLLLNTPINLNTTILPPETITPPPAAASPPVIPIATVAEAVKILTAIEEEAAEKPALVYVSFSPKGYRPRDIEEEFVRREALNTQEYSRIGVNKVDLAPTVNFQRRDDDLLDLVIITSRGEPVRVVVPVTRKEVVEAANKLWETAQLVDSDEYKTYASQLYQWLIVPIEGKLKERQISNLLFFLPAEIRFLPVAALYDSQNQQFLVEKYSSGLAPSLNLNDNRYRPIKDANLLAMGASQFAQPDVSPLPAVRVEIPTIKEIWEGKKTEEYQRYLDQNFTLDNIKRNLTEKPHQIVHLGTHGKFAGREEAYIQLYDSRLGLRQIEVLPLNKPLVELMVLSACETAFGDEIAELGFAGLAVKAGVKSAIGSVWEVSDTGTLALMTEFYTQLKQQTTKAEALRQAQLALLKGKVRKSEDGKKIITPQLQISLEGLPEGALIPEDLSHPFYWAPFTMIGNPW